MLTKSEYKQIMEIINSSSLVVRESTGDFVAELIKVFNVEIILGYFTDKEEHEKE